MLKSERDALVKICRQRERVAKSEVSVVDARRKADFERQLAAEYSSTKRGRLVASLRNSQENVPKS
jgi:hypothetical protein